MTVTALTKVSQRTIRSGCPSCPAEGPFYRATDQDGKEHLIVANGYSQRLDQGDSVPVSYLHVCESGGTGTVTSEPTSEPATGAVLPDPSGLDELIAAGQAAQNAPVMAADDAANDPAADPAAKRVAAAAAIAAALAELDGPQQVDEAQVRKIVEEMTRNIVAPTKTVVVRDNERREVSGQTHKVFERVLRAISARRNVQLVGGPGVGKTHMCSQIAEALGVQLYVIGFHLQSTASELKGYMDARGEFIPTVVYDWASNPEGGLLLTDELDRSHPGIQASLNSLLSNRFIVMPNRERLDLTDKHVVIAATNTTGDGPTWEYPAAQKFSAEFKDRFVQLTVDIDKKIELAAAMAEGADVDLTKRAVEYVQTVRRNVKREAITGVVVSPRASQNMAALLAAGDSWDEAVESAIRKGMDNDAWRKVSAA